MKIKHSLATLAFLSLLAAHASAADIIPLTWTPDGRFEQETTVPASKFVEVCGKLTAGTSVRWQFQASAPMDFNIHFHEGQKVVYPARQEQATKGANLLAVKLDQTYCWMWTNKTSAPASLKLEVRKN